MSRMTVADTGVVGGKRATRFKAVPEYYPLLAHAGLDDCVARRDRETYSVRHFLASVRGLTSYVPAKRHAINLCKDRYHFLIGFAAALMSRHISLLPTCRAPNVLTQLKERYPDAYILTDNEDVPQDIPAYRVDHVVPTFDRMDEEIPIISSDQIAAVVFTSGSSGLPRAHAKTWGAMVMGAEALKNQFGPSDASSAMVMGTVPPQHMFGLETTIMLPLQCGWSVHAGHPVLPADIVGALSHIDQPVWLMTTPIHLRAYVRQQIDLPGLKEIVSATMPLTRSLARKAENLWHAPVREMYGCTEAGVIGTRRTTASQTWSLCSGLRLWQEGDATWVSQGHVGPPLRLVDRITIQDPTQFTLHGPSHDLVKIAGKRASLAALNAILARVDGVVDGVFYRPPTAAVADVRLTAFVVAPGVRASAIQAELRRCIDPVFLPRPLHLVESLPRNSTGKLPQDMLVTFATEMALRSRRRRR